MHQTSKSKKLAGVLIIFTLVTTSLEAISLQFIFYIWYPFQFYGEEIKVLIDSGSKVNIITPAYAPQLSLRSGTTSVRVQKINYWALKTYRITIARFLA